jgi:hypothetical protein
MIIIPKKNETAKLQFNGADTSGHSRNGLTLTLHTIRWSHCTAGILNGFSGRHLPLAHSQTLSTVNLVSKAWICCIRHCTPGGAAIRIESSQSGWIHPWRHAGVGDLYLIQSLQTFSGDTELGHDGSSCQRKTPKKIFDRHGISTGISTTLVKKKTC